MENYLRFPCFCKFANLEGHKRGEIKMPISSIFSSVFYIAFAYYALLGIYILWLNPRKKLNRIFFVATISLSVWAFCFSVANSAPDYETSLFWRRAASLGWGTVHSVILNFFLELTERKIIRKSKWIYALIYIPTLINIYVFGLSEIAKDQYDLVKTTGGWINIPLHTPWDIAFDIYYVTCTLVGVILVSQWGITSKDRKKKKQSWLLVIAYATAVLLGTMTEFIINSFMDINVPQLAPVITLIPISVIFYLIKRHGFMRPTATNQTTEPGKILSEVNLSKFYKIMSMLYIFGGLVSFAAQYFLNREPLMKSLIFSAVLLLIGNILQLIRLMTVSSETKNTLFAILVSISIPFITLYYSNYGSVSVWATPMIFLMLSVIFNGRKLITWLGISILATQIFSWIAMPSATVQVNSAAYIVRVAVLGITFGLAYYINRMYISRLQENEAQINYLRMASHISADFVKVTEFNLDEKIKHLLEDSGTSFQVDRCYFLLYREDYQFIIFRQEWCGNDKDMKNNAVNNLTQEVIPTWLQQCVSHEIIHIPEVDLLPPEKSKVKESLQERKVKTLVAAPVMSKGKALGFLCYETVKDVKVWRKDQLNVLGILVNLLTDALTKVDAEKEISYLAYYDGLTKLPNRLLFKNRLEQSIHLARRTETLIAVMFLDIDAFKGVNDSLGHEGGDELLKEVGTRISSCIRKHDTVARFGGDEFLIQITQLTKAEDIRKIAEKILQVFSHPVTVKEQEFFITASMGIAVYPQDGEDAEVLIKNADLAMYISKDKGRNQYTLCSPTMKDDVIRKMKLTNSLFRAQERNELVLYYQPQVNVTTGEIIGMEALLRWKHPDMGMIPPGQFIPLAEQTGLINSIGQWVIETACMQNKEWQSMGFPPIRVAVNLSIEQFRNPSLVHMIADILNKTQLDPKYLELEITESIAVEEADYVIRILHELKELGVTIAIDDFGMEYSSLSRLKALPVDRIKIAMQFVHGITEESSKDKAITAVIIQLAKSLDLNIIAEGAETEAQVEFLYQQLCDEIQGFYYYKPMPAEELEKILKKE